MPLRRLRSIRSKLLAMVLIASLSTLLLEGLALLYNDQHEYRSEFINEVATQADILGRATMPALDFNDVVVANENLALMQARPEVLAAAIYTANGKLFASYTRADTPKSAFPQLPETEGTNVGATDVSIFRRIASNHAILGTVFIRAKYDAFGRLGNYLTILSVTMLISLLVGLAISIRLQRTITQPIQSVRATAMQVMEQRNFQLRATKTTHDEIGYLVDAFNDMLGEIGQRTQALEHEIAERREIQHSLEESERRNRSLIAAMSSIVWAADPIGSFTKLQPSWQEYTGQKPTAYMGLGWRNAFAPEDQGAVDRQWALAINEPRPFEIDVRLYHAASARSHEITLRAVPVTDASGKLLEWVGTVTDIDARRSAEREVHKLNIELEQRVADRTRQLEEANKDLESFSYSVSHDLRAPVRAITGFTGILTKRYAESLNDDARRLLGVVASESQRMGQLIDELLAFSRLGRQALHPIDVDMGALVRTTFDQLMMSNNVSNTELQVGTLPNCQADRNLIHQVWINLLSNAVKFSSNKQQARIEVGAITDEVQHTYFVRDNGAGFDMAHASKLFGVFHRLHSQDEFPGTGVGLALVNRIVTRHGGKVWADGRPNEGATFYFTLPKEAEDGTV